MKFQRRPWNPTGGRVRVEQLAEGKRRDFLCCTQSSAEAMGAVSLSRKQVPSEGFVSLLGVGR